MDAVADGAEFSCADLADRIIGGDAAAEGLLVARTRPGLIRLLSRRVRDRALAEDLCHDAYAIVLHRLRTIGLDDPAGLAGFLASTARNLAIDHHRKIVRRRTDADPERIAEAADDESADPASGFGRDQLARAVRRLLDELPVERDRELLTRYYLHDEPKEQLCERFGVSDFHFNRILHRARQRFAAIVRERAGVNTSHDLLALLFVLSFTCVSAAAPESNVERTHGVRAAVPSWRATP